MLIPKTLLDPFIPDSELGSENFWQPPKRVIKGDLSPQRIHEMVGLCLSRWELIESQLVFAFEVLTGSKSGASARAFGSVISGPNKASMLRYAGKVFFDDARKTLTDHAEIDGLEKQLDDLLSYYRKAADRRNEIAHGITIRAQGSGSGGTHRLFFLVAPSYMSGKMKSVPLTRFNVLAVVDYPCSAIEHYSRDYMASTTYAYTAAQLRMFAGKFTKLGNQFADYLCSLIHKTDAETARAVAEFAAAHRADLPQPAEGGHASMSQSDQPEGADPQR